jgi:hypothetical protein
MSQTIHLTSKITNQIYGAVNLVTSIDGAHQYGAWYSIAGEAYIGHIERGVQRWGVDHDETLISGAARTALSLPVDADEHNSLSIGINHDLSGAPRRIYLWGNMHANDLKMIRTTTTDGSIASWASTTLPVTGIVNSDNMTYPQPCQHADGSLTVSLRAGASGNGDTWWWTLPVNSDSWGEPRESHTGISSLPNDSAYITPPHYDPKTGRWWMAWCWRDEPDDGYSNRDPSCAYSDDEMVTWKSIDGTTLTLPVTDDTATALILPFAITGGEDGLSNWGSITVDDDGYPHILCSRNPFYHIWWDGSDWNQQQYGATTGTTVNGRVMYGRLDCAWLYNQLVVFAGGGEATSGVASLKNLSAWNLTNGDVAVLSGKLKYDLGGGWECYHDPVAERLFHQIEFLIPYESAPRVFQFGQRVGFGSVS